MSVLLTFSAGHFRQQLPRCPLSDPHDFQFKRGADSRGWCQSLSPVFSSKTSSLELKILSNYLPVLLIEPSCNSSDLCPEPSKKQFFINSGSRLVSLCTALQLVTIIQLTIIFFASKLFSCTPRTTFTYKIRELTFLFVAPGFS